MTKSVKGKDIKRGMRLIMGDGTVEVVAGTKLLQQCTHGPLRLDFASGDFSLISPQDEVSIEVD